MDIVAIIIIVIIGVILVLTFYLIGLYNKLIDSRNRVTDQFNQIDTELKKVVNLVPNLIETVKEYAKHEEKALTEVTNAKNKLLKTNDINEEIKVANNLNKSINKVIMLSETYSELKSNKKFQNVQKELKNIEERIDYAKSFYNDTVLNYNSLREQFPNNIIANIFKFKEINYFK